LNDSYAQETEFAKFGRFIDSGRSFTVSRKLIEKNWHWPIKVWMAQSVLCWYFQVRPEKRDTRMKRELQGGRFKPIITFFCLAYAVSWLFWGLVIALPESSLAGLGYYAGGFGPFIAALVTVAIFRRSPWTWFKSLWRWRVAAKFWLFAFLFPVVMAVGASLVFGLTGGETAWGDAVARLALWPATFATVALIGGGNEELGWRGFGLPELQANLSPMGGTTILGVLWALWHIPLIGATGGGWSAFLLTWDNVIPFAITLVSITAHAFWYTWLFNRTGSVLLCVLLHGGYNAANNLFIFVPFDTLHGPEEFRLLVIMTTLLLISVVGLIVATKGRLGCANAK
jgi:membrane protease YdiL (CAAX protease family)